MTDIRTILCPVDFSPLTGPEIALASGLAVRLGSRMVIQHGVADLPPSALGASWMYIEEHRREQEEGTVAIEWQFRQLLGRLPAGVKGEGILTRGPLDRVLLELASALPADLVVMATHGPSSTEHRSMTERIILDSSCPVLAIGEVLAEPLPDFSGERRIPTLVPVDFSPHSKRVLQYALGLARDLPLDLHLLHVEPLGRSDKDRLERRLEAMVPAVLVPRVTTTVAIGEPAIEILRFEKRRSIRLLIMGSRHKSFLRRMFERSTAQELLHSSPRPVWFVPEGASVSGLAGTEPVSDRSSAARRFG